MHIDIKLLQETLCKAMCAQVVLHKKSDRTIAIETPFTFPDGDAYQLFLTELPTGLLRLTDNGHTMMQMSYTLDIGQLREGTRGNIFARVLAEFDITEDDGAFQIDISPGDLVPAIFKMGQAITKITDLSFLSRIRVEQTFYEDLKERLLTIIDPEQLRQDYFVPQLADNVHYPVDFAILGGRRPIFTFGIPNRDKAKLTTIILEHLLRERIAHESLLVFMDQGEIPKADIARLSNVGGEMVASLDAQEDLRRKIQKRLENGN